MQLKNAYIYQIGTFLFGVDRKHIPHGVFCWSAEQIAFMASEWRFADKDKVRLTKAVMQEKICMRSDKEPELIHGIGARLINNQFAKLENLRVVPKSKQLIPLPHGRIYVQALPPEPCEPDTVLLLYITPEGHPTLAHMRTQDQAEELLKWEDWMEEHGHDTIHDAIHTLPEHDRFNQHPAYVRGAIVEQLIVTHVMYPSYFPDIPTARN